MRYLQGKIWPFVLFIIVLASTVRFLYFPNNIYFGFDQARDAFISQEILSGHFKVVGPPTGVEGWFHGALYYYFYAPIYFIFQGNPEGAAAFLRIANSLAVVLVFFIGQTIFNKRVGIISALLFAFSFEQTQYALYFNHPSLAVLAVLLFYLGLGMLFFQNNQKGLVIALLGLGLSLQFEFVLMYLFPIFLLMLIWQRKIVRIIHKRIIFYSLVGLSLAISTFIVSEVKFHFRSFQVLSAMISSSTHQDSSVTEVIENIYLITQRLFNDNLFGFSPFNVGLFVLLVASMIFSLFRLTHRPKVFFLVLWFLAGTIPYLGNKSYTPLYYYSVAASVAILIYYGFLLDNIFKKSVILGFILLFLPIISNLFLIFQNNQYGSIATINVQSGMLLSDERKAVDYIYQQAKGQPFTVNALTMPFNVNTTWSYLFEWYGKSKYHYLPIWGGDLASGYPGNLKVERARSKLPSKLFLIIEPTRGIRNPLIDNFITNENYFSAVTDEKKIGQFIVQVRKPI